MMILIKFINNNYILHFIICYGNKCCRAKLETCLEIRFIFSYISYMELNLKDVSETNRHKSYVIVNYTKNRSIECILVEKQVDFVNHIS